MLDQSFVRFVRPQGIEGNQRSVVNIQTRTHSIGYSFKTLNYNVYARSLLKQNTRTSILKSYIQV